MKCTETNYKSKLGMGNALLIGKFYKRVDEVKLAIDSYNKAVNNTVKRKCKHCGQSRRTKSASASSSSLSNDESGSVVGNCPACEASLRAGKRGDKALELTKAYTSLLKELDNVEDGSQIADNELVRYLNQTNAELCHINRVLSKNKEKVNDKENETLSLDALEEILGNLMVEADGLEKDPSPTDNNKYHMVMPVLLRIGKMISRHPTKQFLNYQEHLSKLEAAIRVGERAIDQELLDDTLEASRPPSTTPCFMRDVDVDTMSLLSQSVMNGGSSYNELHGLA